MSIALAITGLAVLILVHEAGHMWVARAFGMRVDKFSIFFGPPLLRWRGARTTYQLSAVPLGGYVQIAGMNPNDDLPDDDPGSYQNKSRLGQFATVFAGPAVNYLFAIVLVVLVMLVWGAPRWILSINDVVAGKPAAQAGMRAGDRIVKINQRPVLTVEAVQAAIAASLGKPMQVEVARVGKPVKLTIAPKEVDGGYQIGIIFGSQIKFHPLPAGAALSAALVYPFAESAKILSGLKRLVSGKVSAKNVGGPVEIVRQLKMSFETNLGTALLFLAMLNVYLGLFNLLPLPALDGGRLVFIVASMITRKPVNQRIENMVHTVGFVVLLGLLVVITYRDLVRILS